jgi:hypothetical protein
MCQHRFTSRLLQVITKTFVNNGHDVRTLRCSSSLPKRSKYFIITATPVLQVLTNQAHNIIDLSTMSR